VSQGGLCPVEGEEVGRECGLPLSSVRGSLVNVPEVVWCRGQRARDVEGTLVDSKVWLRSSSGKFEVMMAGCKWEVKAMTAFHSQHKHYSLLFREKQLWWQYDDMKGRRQVLLDLVAMEGWELTHCMLVKCCENTECVQLEQGELIQGKGVTPTCPSSQPAPRPKAQKREPQSDLQRMQRSPLKKVRKLASASKGSSALREDSPTQKREVPTRQEPAPRLKSKKKRPASPAAKQGEERALKKRKTAPSADLRSMWPG
jgi:hypothetical protein